MIARLTILFAGVFGLRCVAFAQAPPTAAPPSVASPGTIALKDALARARQYGGQYQAANLALLQAKEDTKQAKAARLPNVNAFNQFIYTEGNGTSSGVFVANDGVHIYNEQAVVHEDLGMFLRHGEVSRAQAAEAVARAKTEIAIRGVNATVIQNYYAILTAQYRLANLERSVREAERFVDITTKQEKGGEVAHADVLKGQIDLRQRQRDRKEAQLAFVKAKIALGVIIFPNYSTDYLVEDDLQQPFLLPPADENRSAALNSSPDIKSARAGIQQAGFDVSVARYGFLPTFALDFFYGINANQFAARTHYPTENGIEQPYRQNLGYAAQATLTIPVWNWGATRSKVKQAEYRRQQAELDLTLAQRTLQGNVATAEAEARLAQEQLTSLKESSEMATESLRLIVLRYQAGESTALEVVDAQNTLTLARNAYADGLIRYRVALANLQTLTGSL